MKTGPDKRQLIMLGIIHRDEKGPEAMERWMARIDPDVITLEFSRCGRDFRNRYRGEFEARVKEACRQLEGRGHAIDQENMKNLLAYIELPQEFQIASLCATLNSIPLYLIDMDYFSSLKLRKIEELLEPRNMEKLLTGKVGHENGERALARLFFDHGVRAFPYPEEMRIRDRYMRDRIATLMRYHKQSRVLHICGWRHLCDPDRVYEALNPRRIFVHDRAFRI